ncbi:MAG: cobalamin-independent methionine synthase II family protein [Armatimonas sp.]
MQTTTVGSWPRPTALVRAHKAWKAGRGSEEEFTRLADTAVLDWLKLQETLGLDIVTDGEQRRDNFYSFAAEKLEGVTLMSLAEMLDIVEDRVGFERLLQSLDVPAYSILNPTCVGKVLRKAPLALGELEFVKAHTSKPVKVPLPGPYLLTRAMWVKEVTRNVYESKEALAEDVIEVLRGEIADLIAGGAAFVQLDEPVLTEVALNPGGTRTFMCAALASRADPTEELEWAVSLINRTLEGFRGKGARLGLHVCRGNWSVNESTLLRGAYHPLAPYLVRLDVDQLVLEFATPRAGELSSLFEAADFSGKELGFGVVNPRTPEVETVEQIRARVQEAKHFLPTEKLFLNPDCGFATFATRPMNEVEIATQKLKAMIEAGQITGLV